MVKMLTYSAGNSLHRQCGYTLIELLVVLSIMAGLFAVVPPLFSSASSANEVRAISRQMTAVLRQARSNAVAVRAPIDFTLDLEQRRYQLPDRPPVQLPADLELTMITGESELRGKGRGAIRFFADGSSTGGRITLSSSNHVRQLDVEWLSGRVTATELPSVGDATP
jgi:general secretion pathway protein H